MYWDYYDSVIDSGCIETTTTQSLTQDIYRNCYKSFIDSGYVETTVTQLFIQDVLRLVQLSYWFKIYRDYYNSVISLFASCMKNVLYDRKSYTGN